MMSRATIALANVVIILVFGLTQLRSSVSQTRVFACGSMSLCAVFPRYARKNRT